jgi:hypothetical protein
MTIEPTVSFWDCGEFITTAYKFQVGHPPGAPLFMIVGSVFLHFLAGAGDAAMLINAMSALASAFTIMFLFWTITHLAKKLGATRRKAFIGTNHLHFGQRFCWSALAYTFSDTFWFSAVEGEVYAFSSLMTANCFLGHSEMGERGRRARTANRWLIFIAYIIGLSIGVHLLNLLAIPAIVFVYYFKKYEVTRKGVHCCACSFDRLPFLELSCMELFRVLLLSARGSNLLFVNTFGLPFHSGLLFYIAVNNCCSCHTESGTQLKNNW